MLKWLDLGFNELWFNKKKEDSLYEISEDVARVVQNK